jgi:hypothetical protein
VYNQVDKFHTYNPTRNVRNKWLHSGYLSIGNMLSHRLFFEKPRLQQFIRYLSRVIDRVYNQVNTIPTSGYEIQQSIREILTDYYQDEIVEMERLINQQKHH